MCSLLNVDCNFLIAEISRASCSESSFTDAAAGRDTASYAAETALQGEVNTLPARNLVTAQFLQG